MRRNLFLWLETREKKKKTQRKFTCRGKDKKIHWLAIQPSHQPIKRYSTIEVLQHLSVIFNWVKREDFPKRKRHARRRSLLFFLVYIYISIIFFLSVFFLCSSLFSSCFNSIELFSNIFFLWMSCNKIGE